MFRILHLTLALVACRGCGSSCAFLTPPEVETDDTEQQDTEDTQDTQDSAPPVDTEPEPPCAWPELEPNNNHDQATEFAMEAYACGDFSGEYDLDFYRFEMPEGGWLRVEVGAQGIGSSAKSFLLLESDSGEAAGSARGVETGDPVLVVPVPEGDGWSISMLESNRGYGEDYFYELIATQEKPPLTYDLVEPEEGTGAWEQAMELELEQRVYGTVEVQTERDWYRVTTPDRSFKFTAQVIAHREGSPINLAFDTYQLDPETGELGDKLYSTSTDPDTSSFDPGKTLDNAGETTWLFRLRPEGDEGVGALYWYTFQLTEQ